MGGWIATNRQVNSSQPLMFSSCVCLFSLLWYTPLRITHLNKKVKCYFCNNVKGNTSICHGPRYSNCCKLLVVLLPLLIFPLSQGVCGSKLKISSYILSIERKNKDKKAVRKTSWNVLWSIKPPKIFDRLVVHVFYKAKCKRYLRLC